MERETMHTLRRWQNLALALAMATAAMVLLGGLTRPVQATPPVEGPTFLFGPTSPLLTPTQRAKAMLVADLTGDGADDLLYADAATVTFATGPDFTITMTLGTCAGTAYALNAADLDHDGDSDVAAFCQGEIRLWRNDGDGWATTVLTDGGTPRDGRLADFDGDGWIDAAATDADGHLRLWRNDHTPFDGLWTTQQALALGSAGEALIVADLNRDGRLDLAATAGTGVRLWSGPDDPFGSSWPALDWTATGASLTDLAVAELSGDGLPDLAAADADGHLLIWTTPFTPGGPFSSTATPATIGDATAPLTAVLLADFDRDGQIDAAAVGGGDPFTTTLWRNSGDPHTAWGAFTVATTTFAPHALLSADVDDDGDLDLLLGGEGRLVKMTNLALHRAARFLEADSKAIAETASDLLAAAMGDLNRDGYLDLLVGDADGHLVAWFAPSATWTAPWTPITIGESSTVREVVLLDVDGDGDLDLASGHGSPPYLHLWRNPGDESGHWTSVVISGPQRPIGALIAADFDHDGRPDLACGTGRSNDAPSPEHGLLLWHNDGEPWTGNLSATMTAIFTYPVNALAAGDLDRDGWPDLVAGTDHAPAIGTPDDPQTETWPLVWEVMAMRNPGDPFTQPWTKTIVGRDAATITLSMGHYHGYWGVTVYDVQIVDLDGDGWLDVATADHVSADYQVKVWRNDGTPFDGQPDHFHWTWEPTAVWYGSHVPWMGGSALALTAADFTLDGRPDLMPGIEFWQRIWFEQDGPPFGATLTDTHWAAHTFGVSGEQVQRVLAADFDRDGDPDVAFVGKRWDGPELALWRNGTGGVALDATPTAPPPIPEGQRDDILRLTLVDNGLTDESSVRLARLRLRFTTPEGEAMDDLSARLSHLWLYRDTGNHRWSDSDRPVYTLTAPTPDAEGYLTLTLAMDDPLLVVAPQEARDYFVVVEAASGAMNSSPNAFRLFFDGDDDGWVVRTDGNTAAFIQETERIDSGIVTLVGPPTHVTIETEADGSGEEPEAVEIALGYQRPFYAISRDALEHFVATVPVTWAVRRVSGNIAPDDLVPAADRHSAIFYANAMGTASLLITHTNLGTDTLPLLRVTGPPTTITLEVEPSALIADGADEGIVRAHLYDAIGNPIADGTPVTFTRLSALRYGDLVPGSPLVTATSDGVATATVRAGTTTGAIEVRAETGSISELITVPVVAGAAATLQIEGYTTWTPAGSPLYTGPEVTVLDAFGNIKSDYTGTVYFLSSDPRALLSYTIASPYTFTPVDAGSHRFPGDAFRLFTAGDQVITVTDGLLTATSGPIDVRPALEPYTIVLTLSHPVITTGLRVTATTVAYDRYGNSKGDWTANCTYAIEPQALGRWISPNVYLAQTPGRWTVTAQAVMSPRPVDTATLVVLPTDVIFLPLVMRGP